MSTQTWLSPAHRWTRSLVVGAVFLVAAIGAVQPVVAATARVTWLPRGSGTVSGYRIYLRNEGTPYVSTPQWTGNPAPAADGSLSTTFTYTAAPSGVNYFAVSAVSTTSGETVISNEGIIGTPNPCRNDSCATKTSCNFTNYPDGTACDDASFCNGAEVCIGGVCDTSRTRDCSDAIDCTVDACDDTAGKCTHSGPPGCCLACDTSDPCLAAACAEGDCSAGPGTEIEVNRIRFMNKKSGIKLAGKGTFEADPAIDPTTTGAVLQFRAPDGAVLYASEIAAHSIKASSYGGRYRFSATRAESDFLGNGLTRLDFRIKGSTWLVTIKAETPELMDAFLEPTVTWVIWMGSNCVRHMDLMCNQNTDLSVCR
jgi:hypothetical protein